MLLISPSYGNVNAINSPVLMRPLPNNGTTVPEVPCTMRTSHVLTRCRSGPGSGGRVNRACTRDCVHRRARYGEGGECGDSDGVYGDEDTPNDPHTISPIGPWPSLLQNINRTVQRYIPAYDWAELSKVPPNHRRTRPPIALLSPAVRTDYNILRPLYLFHAVHRKSRSYKTQMRVRVQICGPTSTVTLQLRPADYHKSAIRTTVRISVPST